jgi:hypothetical protein
MKFRFSSVFLSALLFTSFSTPAPAQEQAVKRALSGRRMLVTYRDGGALYGTYHLLDVHFCASGNYMAFGQNRKTTVLNNTQASSFNDRGRWDVASFNGRTVLRSQSTSGQSNVFPVALLPSGGIWLGEGVSVVPRGAAGCR